MDVCDLLHAEYQVAEKRGYDIYSFPPSYLLKTKDVADTLKALINRMQSDQPDVQYCLRVMQVLGKHLAPTGQGKKRDDLDFRVIGPLLKHGWMLVRNQLKEGEI